MPTRSEMRETRGDHSLHPGAKVSWPAVRYDKRRHKRRNRIEIVSANRVGLAFVLAWSANIASPRPAKEHAHAGHLHK